jgi:hypothetical protein
MDAFEPEDYGKMVKYMLNKEYDMEVTQLFFRVFAKGPDAIQAVKFLKAMPPVKNLYNFLKSTIGEFKADALSEDDFNKAVKDKFFSTGGQTHELLSVKGGRRQQRSSRRNSQRQQSSSSRNKRNSRSSSKSSSSKSSRSRRR